LRDPSLEPTPWLPLPDRANGPLVHRARKGTDRCASAQALRPSTCPFPILARVVALRIVLPCPLTPLIQVKDRTLSKQARRDPANAALRNATSVKDICAWPILGRRLRFKPTSTRDVQDPARCSGQRPERSLTLRSSSTLSSVRSHAPLSVLSANPSARSKSRNCAWAPTMQNVT
jgi:hypothetical protein